MEHLLTREFFPSRNAVRRSTREDMLWLVHDSHHVLIEPGCTSALVVFGRSLPGPARFSLYYTML